MTYNILAEVFATPTHHEQCKLEHLMWAHRSKRILGEIAAVAPDVLCLQELDHYKDFSAELAKIGYDSQHKPRTKLSSVFGGESDSCAIFYKNSRYNLIDTLPVILDHVAMKDPVTKNFPNPNIFIRQNVALFVSLEDKQTKQRLVVGTAHLFWNPEFTHVKMAQAAFLVEQLAAFLAKNPTPHYVLTGDFNSLPTSAVYEYVTRGALGDHPERAKFFPAFSWTHTLRLRSAYAGASDPITNWTKEFKGCLDYIFCSETAAVASILEPLAADTPALSMSQGASPNEWMPSDHIPLAVRLALRDAR